MTITPLAANAREIVGPTWLRLTVHAVMAIASGFLIGVTNVSTAYAACEDTPSSSGFTCQIDGSASGQLFSPASKIVRQGITLGIINERRRTRETGNSVSDGLDGDVSTATDDASLPQLNSTHLQRLFEAALSEEGVESRAGATSDSQQFTTASATVEPQMVGVFLLGSIGWEDQDETSRENGYDTDRVGVAGGMDFRFGSFLAGAAIDYVREDMDFDHDAGDSQNHEIGFQVYGVYYFLPNAYGMVGGRIASNDYDIARKIHLQHFNDPEPDTFENVTANDRTDGYKYSFVGGAGYDLPLGGGFSAQFGATIEYEHTKIDAYSDDPQKIEPGAALSFESDKIETLTSTLEIRLQKIFEIENGVIVPWIYSRYFHEFEDDSRTIRATQIESLGFDEEGESTQVVFRTNDPDRNYFSVGGGVLVGIGDGWSGFTAYDVLLGHSFRDEQTLSLGARLTF